MTYTVYYIPVLYENGAYNFFNTVTVSLAIGSAAAVAQPLGPIQTTQKLSEKISENHQEPFAFR